jgi:hypothetical protein
MKKLAILVMLAVLGVTSLVPMAQARNSARSQARATQKMQKRQQKAMRKYMKRQQKAQRKMFKNSVKHTHYPKHSY